MSGLAGPHGFTVNEGKPRRVSAKDPAPAAEELPNSSLGVCTSSTHKLCSAAFGASLAFPISAAVVISVLKYFN